MKVLHLIEPFSSGVTTFIINISSALSNDEHIVVHGARTTADNIEKVKERFDSSVQFILWKNAIREINLIKDFCAFIELIKILKSTKFDVIHLHSSKAGIIGRLACFLLKINCVIYTPHAAAFLRRDISEFKRRFYLFLERVASKLTGKIICCGKAESEYYNQFGIQSIYINNSVKLKHENAVSDYLDNKKTLVIGFFGIASYQKNPKMFSKIAHEFMNDNQIKFRWVGDGDLRNDLNSKSIEKIDWVDNLKQIDCEMEQIDIYLSTSLWEGQPFGVIEAMNHRKCLILSDCIGHRDLVQHNKNGFLYKTKEEAIQLIKFLKKNRNIIKIMGSRSYKMCSKNHNIDINSKKYRDEYLKIRRTNKK